MKLSFSTNRWKGISFHDFMNFAVSYRFSGIEIHDISAFSDIISDSSRIFRSLIERKLSVPCIDAVKCVAEDGGAEAYLCMKAAKALRCPYVRIKADCSEKSTAVIRELIGAAKVEDLTLLVETAGDFCDTKALLSLLNKFSSDRLAALWDPYYTCRAGETPEESLKNLGAYIKHVHIKDADKDGNYELVGEGVMPISEVIDSLRSINYDGFVSAEWDPAWSDSINDIEIILPHFETYMLRYDDPKKNRKALYETRRGTGKYVWKRDALIEKTFSQVLDTMVENFPDQLAFKYTTLDYTRSYRAFRDDVDEFARSLIAMGVKAGSHVALWATNVPQWYIAFWATTKIGAVLVTVNTAYKIHEAEYLLKQSDTHTLIMIKGYRDSHYDEIVAELCPELETLGEGKRLHSARLPFLRNVVTIGYEQKGCIPWEKAVEMGRTVPLEEVRRMASCVSIHDVCNMQYTSGTTGFPKGVMLTHYNIVNNGKCIGDRMELSTADRMMLQVPMFHCFGMVLAMTATMTHGGTILPLPYFSPKPALACINTEKITAFHGVPTMFIAMLEHKDFEKTDFSHMRTGIMAGSPCPEPIMQQVLDKMNMKEITIVYGQTEASPGCTMSSTDDSIEVRVSTVGAPLPEIECKIIDPETGLEVADNVTGEFVARGYNIMKGYYKMPAATRDTIDKDGWLHTGDLALRTPEGNYRITGRLKDMIIRGGENIYPKEIEEFIYTHPKVKDVQVIGVPDEQYGEEIMACIILKKGEQMTVEEMKDYIKAHMAKHKVPRYIDFIEAFPMNAAGKILKYKMREDAAERLGIKKIDGIVAQ